MSDYELQADFALEVIEESTRVPVVVDFWAEWCGPCRVLSPVLEKLAGEAAGAWKLVKVNTELNPELAQALRIRSIPTVMMIVDGKRSAEFVGALPERQVRSWLEENLPPAKPDAVAGAREAIETGNPEEAEKRLKKVLEKEPENHEARLLWARIRFPRDPAKAAEIAAGIPEDHPLRPEAEAFRHLVALFRAARDGKGPQGPEGDVALYRDGALAASRGEYAKALDGWIELISRNRELDDDGARRACVALFTALGDESPVTREYRRKLASVLY